MRIRLSEIPQGGRDFSFDLDSAALNERIAAAERGRLKDATPCVFFSPIKCELRLDLEGSTVHVKGAASGRYMTTCSRCAEESEQELSTKIEMILKPQVTKGDDDEDVAYGFYADKEVQCGEIVEEFLILALPYAVHCSESCRGLCPQCGQNLNVASCSCGEEKPVDPRLAALKQVKVTH